LSTSTLENFCTPTDMKVESTSTSISTDKGKAPEINIPPINKEPLDYNHIHASGSWADETEKDIIHQQNKYQPFQLDAILTQINNVSQQLADIHHNLAFTLTRVNPINEIDENIDQNDVVIAGIDTSKSTIRRQEAQVTELQLENSILKQNLSANFDKLNKALATVAQMQRMLVHQLVKLALSSFYDDKNYEEIVFLTSRTPVKKVSFQYNNMSNDDWSAFPHKTDTLLTSCQLATMEKPKSLKKVYRQIRIAQKLEKLSKKAFISNRIPTQWSKSYDKTVKIAVALKFVFPPIIVQTHLAIHAIIPTIRALIFTLTVIAR
ncbi:15982_t:CDS:2, partial [Funneliformis geosporum]